MAAEMEFSPYRLSGTVYGALLNHSSALTAMGPRISQPPYQAAPVAPVLYLKPRNTLARSGAAIAIPADVAELEIGACLGVLIGRSACRLSEGEALEYVAGYLAVNDVSVPHDSYYRPSVRHKARDGFCPLGDVTAAGGVANPNALMIRTYVDGQLVHTASTADLVRSVQRLLADVTEFMTLAPGDVLATGVAAPAPRVRAGQRVDVAIDGLQPLSNTFARVQA